MNQLKNGFALALMGAATLSQAAAVDVTDVVADIGAQLTPIGLIASAVLLVHLGVKAFKWVRAAMA
jgi:hypothetical protein